MPIALLLTMLTVVGSSTRAADYFVGKHGDDTNDGGTGESAFLTIQKGVDALQTGDVLTIGPGEYAESVSRENLGGPDNDTVIQAEIPGTVLLRGDVPVAEFAKVDGFQSVYAIDFERQVQSVNEIDTLTIVQMAPNLAELEFSPGGCYHDVAEKKLYISSSDMRPPETHHYSVSVIRGPGLLLLKPHRVIVDGLSATGFHSSVRLNHYPGNNTVWGFTAHGATKCVIRNCTAFLNGGGIGVVSPKEGEGRNLIEKCQGFANYTRHTVEGGNICVFQSCNDEIRDCYAYLGQPNGIRHYGAGVRGPALLKNTLVWGSSYADIFLKGGQIRKYGMTENCIALGILHSANIRNSIVGTINQYNRKPGRSTIMYASEARSVKYREFADPDNLDFRLQATSKFRGTGPDGADRGPFPYEPNILYVRPDGNDQADGLSIQTAWRTLAWALPRVRPGDTLYLAGGVYDADTEFRVNAVVGESTAIRGRGTDPVIIKGLLTIAGSGDLTFERLNFAATIQLENSENVRFNNCRFSSVSGGIRAQKVSGLRITHSEFTGFTDPALQLTGCSAVFVSANIFDNDGASAVQVDDFNVLRYSDYNAYRSVQRAWKMKDVALSLVNRQTYHDQHSRVQAPEYEITSTGLPMLRNPHVFAAGGPNGTGFGFYRENRDRDLGLKGPVLHSVTATTANIEWRASQPAKVVVGWGDTPACENTTTLSTKTFGTFSLTGLEPGKRYHFRIVSADERQGSVSAPPRTRGVRPDAPPLTFRTLAEAVAPVVYYVSTDGNNGNTGLSRDQAWRTVTHAATVAKAGDTVLIAGGEYTESVRVRGTGDKGRPVTFRAIPGEKVVFDGNGNMITVAFAVSAKQHIRFDGLYFKMFGNGGWDSVINVFDSRHIQATRCFMNGYGGGNSPQFLRTANCDDVLMQNCVIANGFQGTYFTRTTNLRIENNVFLRNLICAILNSGGGPGDVVVKNNIFVDSIPSKVKVHLFELGGLAQYVFDNNCFYLRMSDEERKPFLFYGTGPGRLSIAEYDVRSRDSRSFIGDPKFRLTTGVEPTDRNGKKIEFLADWVVSRPNLDFPLLFSTHPELIKRKIGLIPEAFRDFAFDARAGE
ncbi:MAG: hypothetical protein HN742_20490 [Lentisphaerae bacterium]|jgi:hypothetical protein|nr:hypothetical protein [Lentisphaerota bacterium]MBT5611510.1 hypothetical protein [Lentisphaerota bacterium]MBT7054746.1 hypothetical protein [Lentisphaerota bacterium]MBT7844270.1 hypothetical protein [Lentisphaerota bacterium]